MGKGGHTWMSFVYPWCVWRLVIICIRLCSYSCTAFPHTHTHHTPSQITELVHQRDTTRMLINCRVTDPRRFEWLSQMRFYFDPKKSDVLQQLSVHMANAQFNYGFEYLGVQDKLVQTPLTDRCYLTMTQALEERLGGSPFGMWGKKLACG